MKNYDAILPSVTPAGPNVLKSYANYHRKQDLEQCVDIIKRLFPEMSKTTDDFIKSYGLRANNMFIMKKKTILMTIVNLFSEYSMSLTDKITGTQWTI